MSASRTDSPWYVEAFGSHYLRVYAHRDERDAQRAVDCITRELKPRPDTRLLDLCCGAGRHLRLLEAMAPRSVGLDLSPHLLTQARADGVDASLVRGDILRLPFKDNAFDMVVNLFTSFGYFQRDEENEAVAKGIARVLEPGGRVMFDIINPTYTLSRLVPESVEHRNGMEMKFKRHFDSSTKRVVKEVNITFEDDTPPVSYHESVRLYEADEFDGLLASVGFDVLKRLGNFDSSAFTSESPRQIVVACRK